LNAFDVSALTLTSHYDEPSVRRCRARDGDGERTRDLPHRVRSIDAGGTGSVTFDSENLKFDLHWRTMRNTTARSPARCPASDQHQVDLVALTVASDVAVASRRARTRST